MVLTRKAQRTATRPKDLTAGSVGNGATKYGAVGILHTLARGGDRNAHSSMRHEGGLGPGGGGGDMREKQGESWGDARGDELAECWYYYSELCVTTGTANDQCKGIHIRQLVTGKIQVQLAA
jgi:hypothetical protein